MLAMVVIVFATAAVFVSRSMHVAARRNLSEKLAARSAEVRRDYPQRGVLPAVAAVNAWKDARSRPSYPRSKVYGMRYKAWEASH